MVKHHNTPGYEEIATYLDVGAGDNVGFVAGLAGGPHLVLPPSLESQPGEHDGLGRPHGADSDGRLSFPKRSVKQMRDHVHATVLQNINSGVSSIPSTNHEISIHDHNQMNKTVLGTNLVTVILP
jgi:hypothetical protein